MIVVLIGELDYLRFIPQNFGGDKPHTSGVAAPQCSAHIANQRQERDGGPPNPGGRRHSGASQFRTKLYFWV